MKAGKQVQQVKKQLTIRKYMHMQFLRIGFAVSGVVGVLALIGIYEGVLLAKEDTKFGLMPEEVMDFIHEIVRFQHIKVQGLMTIAPFVENPEENRIHFANLRKLSVDIAKEKVDNVNMSILSMGMTNDYEVAIEEGATMVRIGTGIFGARNYNI